jgi:YesN/AraC family two-component response regulator
MVMPGMDGIQVIKSMRKNAKLKSIPVIFQTSNEEELHKGIQAGADYYIKKPFKDDQLQTTFKAAVKKFNQIKELNKELQKGSEGLDLLMNGKFEFTNLNQADALAAVLAQSCPNPDKIIMGISELLINAIEHGNLAITYEEKSELTMKGDWKSEVSRRLEDEKYSSRIAKVDLVRDKDKISITIEDEGAGFNWNKYMEFDPARAFDAHGRGIATANQICFDSLEYKGSGNIVIVTVNLS